MSDQPIIYMHHIRAVSLCSRGTRSWFRNHGIDWDGFLTNGVPAERLTETGDPLALRVVAFAMKEASDGK